MSQTKPAPIDEEQSFLRFKKLDPRALLPGRGSTQAAGLDICSIEDVTIGPKQRALVKTGLSVAIPEGYYGRLAPRSGLALRSGLDVLSGVIDADYRGEIGCILFNSGDEPIHLPAQAKICQMIIEKIIMPTAMWVDDLSETRRGGDGFGSTG